jgi:hypothetical protein
LITASRMVMDVFFPLISTTAGSLTPGLLLFSLPGRGASLEGGFII